MRFILSAVALLVLAGNLAICQTPTIDNRRITLSFTEDIDLTQDDIEYLTNRMENTIGNVEDISVDGQTVTLTFTDVVTEIGEEAFYDFPLTSITIPNSVIKIGDTAFAGCSSLTSISIPNSVTRIGNEAFAFCSSLTSVTIPNSETMIGDGAFFCCSSLTSITIPNSVTMIGDWAFYECSSLTSITIPNSVTMIGDWAFYCSSLTSVIIPNSVTEIGYRAFAGCPLESVTVPRSAEIDEDSFEETTRIIYQ